MPKGIRSEGRFGGEYEPRSGVVRESVANLRAAFMLYVGIVRPDLIRALADSGDARAWASAIHIEVPWAIEIARATLKRWTLEGRDDWLISPEVERASWTGREVGPPPEWDPTMYTEASYRSQVEDYIRRVHETAGQLGFQRSMQLPEADRDLEWLARYQVDGRDYDQIAALAFPDNAGASDRVRKAVGKMAKAIGLPLRKAKRRTDSVVTV